MLDIQFIRDNRDLVAEKSKQKGYDVSVNELLKIDELRRHKLQQVQSLRQNRNQQAESLKQGKPTQEQIAKGREIKEELAAAEADLDKLDTNYTELLKQVPNMPADDVPIGISEAENVVAKQWGKKPEFEFEPKTHWQIAELRGLIDKERAAKVAGARFAYIKGGLVKLQFSLMQFVVDTLTDEKILSQIIQDNNLEVSHRAFEPILPPAMIRTEIYDAMDRLEPREDRYKIEGEELWLQGSAEHTLGPMYASEILTEDDLPRRYIGFLTSFRKEAGTYGKDTEGIIRMHQFDKLEMESFTTAEQGMNEHLLMIAIQEYLMQQLGLPYQVLQKCTADIGKPNARGVDIEAWMPGASQYRETHTADYMTDYQARRLATRYKPAGNGPAQLVHTNDATALALGRTLVAIIENYQTSNGIILVPEILKQYMKGAESI